MIDGTEPISHHSPESRPRKANWWSAYFNEQRLPALTAPAIENARLELRRGTRYLKMIPVSGPERSNGTINRFTDWLRRACNWAVKMKQLRENPVKAIERHQEDEAPTFQYSPDQEARLMEHLTDEEIDMLRLAALTGMRRGNQFTLRKDQINLGIGAIILPRTKTRKSRIVHLSEETKEILRRRWLAISIPHTFTRGAISKSRGMLIHGIGSASNRLLWPLASRPIKPITSGTPGDIPSEAGWRAFSTKKPRSCKLEDGPRAKPCNATSHCMMNR